MGAYKTADWEPGTLDKTRKAIGDIAPDEAAQMAKKLGGEVMNERRAPSAAAQARRSARPAPANAASGAAQKSAGGSAHSGGAQTNASPANGAFIQVGSAAKRRRREDLQALPPKLCARIDKLMMSDEYQIKPNYGIFNFVRKFQKDGMERIIYAFFDSTLKLYVATIESFIADIKTLIQIAPNSYKAKIAKDDETKFKFLRMVASWTAQPIKLAYFELQDAAPPLIVADLIPLVKAIYKPIMMVYYYGHAKIPKLIKEIYADEAAYRDAKREKLSALAKNAVTEWLYIENDITKKLYPLLMRMCTDDFAPYPEFFTSKIANILQFVGLHKYDLLLPERPKAEAKAEEETKKTPVVEIRGKRDEVVDAGLDLLDRLFPQAGFKKLDARPDFYPYFQPLYGFDDGFNMLSPVNPMQATVVLLRIIEDFLQGCRNVKFADSENDSADDTIAAVLDEWSVYIEDVFQKLYCEPLKDLVNHVYSQDDFAASQFGKKLLNDVLWQTQYQFLPLFKFDQLVLERPRNESKYRPLYFRTDFIRKYLTDAVNACDAARPSRGSVAQLANPWEHYEFSMPNEVSKRIDVLLGAQNRSETTNATNANLLKYTLCVVAVLDWWINNPESPAYTAPPAQVYRVSAEDGKPLFSVPERSDQNKLFAEAVRAAYQKK